jgi:hypothetical protein
MQTTSGSSPAHQVMSCACTRKQQARSRTGSTKQGRCQASTCLQSLWAALKLALEASATRHPTHRIRGRRELLFDSTFSLLQLLPHVYGRIARLRAATAPAALATATHQLPVGLLQPWQARSLHDHATWPCCLLSGCICCTGLGMSMLHHSLVHTAHSKAFKLILSRTLPHLLAVQPT